MDLNNMRANGVRSLLASCLDCYHDGMVNVDDQPGHLAVPSFARRMRSARPLSIEIVLTIAIIRTVTG
jgi:hypothetical protein